jgi:hypothetical protein
MHKEAQSPHYAMYAVCGGKERAMIFFSFDWQVYEQTEKVWEFSQSLCDVSVAFIRMTCMPRNFQFL